MDTLKRLTPIALLFAAPAAAATNVGDWAVQIHEASRRFGIPEQWIRNVMSAESAGRTQINGRPITSRSGAMGLMQLMPGTWMEMRRTYRLGSDPYDPRDNVLAGAAYLRAMVDQFGYPAALAAYNAGPTRLGEFLATGRPLPAETMSYVEHVARPERSQAKSGAGRRQSRRGSHTARRIASRKLLLVTQEMPFAPGSVRTGAGNSLFAIDRGRTDD